MQQGIMDYARALRLWHRIRPTLVLLLRDIAVVSFVAAFLVTTLGGITDMIIIPERAKTIPLVSLLVSGALMILLRPERGHAEAQAPGRRRVAAILLVGLAGAALVFVETASLGWFRFIFVIFGGATVAIAFFALTHER